MRRYFTTVEISVACVASVADEEQIQKQLNAKLDAMLRRMYFTRYKTAPTEEERESARRKYLDSAGILADFRW